MKKLFSACLVAAGCALSVSAFAQAWPAKQPIKLVAVFPPGGSVDQVARILAPALQQAELKAGIWSRVRDLSTPLRDLDRVEIYRPLQVDPKEARRLRYKRDRGQKSRASKPGQAAGS